MRNSNILLTILPPFWPNMAPVGLGYLDAFLKRHGVNSKILDLNNFFYNLVDKPLKDQWFLRGNTFLEENILNIVKDRFPRQYQEMFAEMLGYNFVGFSCFKSNFKAALETAKLLKLIKKDVKIIFGGPEVARQFFRTGGAFDEELLEVSDFLVVGEGEKSLYEYVTGNHKGKIGQVSVFDELNSPQEIVFPKYEGLDFKSYPRSNAVPLQFSRGCVRRCNFCSERLLYKGYRNRPVKSLIDEIRYHKDNGIKYFVFFDSMINASVDKLRLLCDGIIENFGSVNWEAQIAVRNDMDDDLFDKIKRSGCYNLFVGLESGCDVTLKNMNKGFTAKEALGFFERLNKARLWFGVSMIVGYPRESDSDFRESLDFIIRNREIIPKIEQVNPFTYYEGTAADKSYDYRLNKISLERMEIFVKEVKHYGIKHTNAFIGNLIEKSETLNPEFETNSKFK